MARRRMGRRQRRRSRKYRSIRKGPAGRIRASLRYPARYGGNGYPSDYAVYRGIGLPDQLYLKLRYTESMTLTTGALGAMAVQQFRGNSLFDPNLTGTGLQPEYFDQVCSATALYTQYLVHGSSIKIRCASAADTFALGNTDIAVVPSQTAFASTGWVTIEDIYSTKMARKAHCSHTGNKSVSMLKHYASTHRVFDCKDIQDNLAIFAGTSSANPSASWNWIIASQGMDRSTAGNVVNIQVEITYYTRFFNLTDRPLS